MAVVAGSLIAYGLFGGRDDVTVEASPGEADRGYYLTHARLVEFGADGSPRIVLRADAIEQQLTDQTVLLTDIELDYTAPDAGAWTVVADRGRMPADATALLLSGDVRVTGAEARGATVIRTDQLSYDTVTSVVQTAAPVTVQFGDHRLEGRGLRVVLNTGTLRLESNVHGSFNP